MEPRDLDPAVLGYIAGIVDGEGCFPAVWARAESKPRPPACLVVSTAPVLLEYLEQHLGGAIRERPNKNPRAARSYEWSLRHSRRASLRPFLEAVRPYLVLKGPQADSCLRQIETGDAHREYEVRKALNRRGPP